MTLSEAVLSAWQQALIEGKNRVELEGKSYRVETLRKKKLRVVDFFYDSQQITGIEQNPQTKSVWAKMAREGKRIMQFRCEGRYIGNVAEGRLTRYGAWQALSLPE